MSYKMPIESRGHVFRHAPDLNAATFENLDINLVELYRAALTAGSAAIEGRTFTNCRIEGPAVLLVLEKVHFSGTNFGPVEDIKDLILRPSSDRVVGALPLRNCTFVKCELFALGFTGHSQFLDELAGLRRADAPV